MGVSDGVDVWSAAVDPQVEAGGRVGLTYTVSTFPFKNAHLIVYQKPGFIRGLIK